MTKEFLIEEYKYKKTKELIKQLKPFYEQYKEEEKHFSQQVAAIEDALSLVTGIEDIELIFSDNDFVGIGNADRTMELIHREDIENG